MIPITAPKNDTGKSAVESWTNWLNIAALVFLAVAGLPEVTALIPVAAMPYILAAVAVVNVLLRTFRTEKRVTSLLP